ncbi:MAG: hypothetical protein QME62_02550, partial [Armatimonadota bacterium]|nr:hypothetical protein [Armatimonadota bacterium]
MNLDVILEILQGIPSLRQACDALHRDGATVQVEGLTTAAKGAFIAAVRRLVRKPILLITFNYEQAESLYDDITAFGYENGDIILVPPAESMTYQESDVDLDVIGRRLSALISLLDNKPVVVIAPIGAVLQKTIPPDVLSAHRIRIENGEMLDLDACVRALVDFGYDRTHMVERQGEF